MDESEVRQLLTNQFGVSRGTLDRLSAFVELLKAENERHNLVSRTSLDDVWSRHILDSAQLAPLALSADTWLDLGTGAGFPGLVVAAIHSAEVTMVESRPLRVEFLTRAAELLGLPASTRILSTKVERLPDAAYDVISARAFAPLDRLLALAERFAAPETRWVLPKGRNAQAELDTIRATWQGTFHVEQSLTDAEAGIIVAQDVRRRVRGGQGTR
jgi:16S rRNA (guanine527-N7)-methyltransferase